MGEAMIAASVVRARRRLVDVADDGADIFSRANEGGISRHRVNSRAGDPSCSRRARRPPPAAHLLPTPRATARAASSPIPPIAPPASSAAVADEGSTSDSAPSESASISSRVRLASTSRASISAMASRSSSSSSKVSDGSSEVTASPSSPSASFASLAASASAGPRRRRRRRRRRRGRRERRRARRRARLVGIDVLVFASFGDGGEGSLRDSSSASVSADVSRVGARRAPPRRAAAHAEDLRQGLGAHRGEGVEVAAGGAELRAELEGVRLESCALVRVVVRVEGRALGTVVGTS